MLAGGVGVNIVDIAWDGANDGRFLRGQQYLGRRTESQDGTNEKRPLAAGQIPIRNVTIYALILGIVGETNLFWKVNALCGWLSLTGMFGYMWSIRCG